VTSSSAETLTSPESDPRDETALVAGGSLAAPLVEHVDGGEVACFSHAAPGKELDENEDACLVLPHAEGVVLAVADGVGGAQAGARAARLALETIRRHVAEGVGSDAENGSGSALRARLLDAIEAANAGISALGLGAATTIVIATIERGVLRSYHAGDSAVLVVGQRGKIKLQSVAHSPVGYAVESGWLDDAEAIHHEDRHIISNTLGAPDMRIEIGAPLTLAPRDTVLLASDGLFDNLYVDEIVEWIRKGPLEPELRHLASEARRRMVEPGEGEPSKPDDLTALLYRSRRRRSG
jgi:protein phosphatase